MAQRKPQPKKWDLVEVTWLDAVGPSGQLTMEGAEKYPLATRRTVGYLIVKNDEKIVLAATDDRPADDGYIAADVNAIPTPWATTIDVIRRDSDRKKSL